MPLFEDTRDRPTLAPTPQEQLQGSRQGLKGFTLAQQQQQHRQQEWRKEIFQNHEKKQATLAPEQGPDAHRNFGRTPLPVAMHNKVNSRPDYDAPLMRVDMDDNPVHTLPAPRVGLGDVYRQNTWSAAHESYWTGDTEAPRPIYSEAAGAEASSSGAVRERGRRGAGGPSQEGPEDMERSGLYYRLPPGFRRLAVSSLRNCTVHCWVIFLLTLLSASMALFGMLGRNGERLADELFNTNNEVLKIRRTFDKIDRTNIVILQNDNIKVGVDLNHGGAISYLSAAANDLSVVNTFDNGRHVQSSVTAGPDTYTAWKCKTSAEKPWQARQAGDMQGHRSKILSHQYNKTANRLKVKVQPLQWACSKRAAEMEFEQEVALDGTAVWVKSTVRLKRSDVKRMERFGMRDHELPSAYINGFLNRLITYTGGKPFTGQPMEEHKPWFDTVGGFWVPGPFDSTEHWAAFLDPNGWGVGLYTPNFTRFIGGFAGEPAPTLGSYDAAAGYLSSVETAEVSPRGTFSYQYALILGDIQTIRSYVYSHKDAAITPRAAGTHVIY